ncbi:MAG TPA: hypothetical protein VIO60_00015 [Rectinemataceae bacterium]
MKKWNGMPELFDLGSTAFFRLFAYLDHPWEALTALDSYLGMLLAEDPLGEGSQAGSGAGSGSGSAGTRADLRLGRQAVVEEGARIEGSVHIGAGTVVESGAYIRGPAWIGERCSVRQGAYLRGFVLAGDGVVLGHASEFKRCILLEGSQAPHFNYVGDSVLGLGAHIGAGVILSNVRLDKRGVRTALLPEDPEAKPRLVDTGLDKFGAILGDACEVGCNTVLNPGTILGAHCVVPPLSNIRGTFAQGSRLA